MNRDWFKNSVEFRSFLMIFAAVGLFLATSAFVQARAIILHSETSDFSAYFSAYSIKSEIGEGIYDPDNFVRTEASDSISGHVREYLYSPLFADVLSFFMPMDYTLARLVWLMIEHASVFFIFVLSALILIKSASAKVVPAFAISALLIFSFSALERSFHYGQASAVVALFLYLGVFLHCAGRTYFATFFAAFGAILKIYPVIYLFALLIKGKYRESGMMIFFMAGIVLMSMLIFGPGDWAQFAAFQTGNPLVDRGAGASGGVSELAYEVPNYSPTALLFLLSDQMGWGWSQTQIWEVVRALVVLIGAIIYAFLWRRIYQYFGFNQVIGLGLIGIMLVSPLLWNHVFIMLIPIYSIMLYRAIFDTGQSGGSFLWLLVSFALVAFPDFLTNMEFTNSGILVLLKYTKLYGLLILAYFLCFSSYSKSWREEHIKSSI